MTIAASPHVRYTRLDRPQFEALMRAYEAFISGKRGGPVVTARFLLARDMSSDGRVLHDIDFTGSDLSGSSFVGCDLRRAAFYCVNLSQCDFRRARLERADLRGCKLAGADLGGAVLDEADMRAAVLFQADEAHGLKRVAGGAGVAGARMDGVNLEDGHAFAVDFSNCSLRGARMKNANLKNANFTDANLDGADLTGARLGGARFDGAILTGVDTAQLGLPKSAFANAVTEPTEEAVAAVIRIREEIEFAHAWVSTGGKAGRPARLDGMDLRPAADLFRNRMLVGMSAKGCNAIGVDFTDAELAGANFDGADLRAANFRGADLRGASFCNAKLTHAVLHNAQIDPLPLHGGGVRPTRFDDAALDGCRLAADVALPALKRA